MRHLLLLTLLSLATLAQAQTTRLPTTTQTPAPVVGAACTWPTNTLVDDIDGNRYRCTSGLVTRVWSATAGTVGGANQTAQYNNAGTQSGASALTFPASGNAAKFVSRLQINCGHADLDGDLDGFPDSRDVWDYDCDGTQESSDINTAGDFLCAPADGVTQLVTRLADLDSDGTVDDLVCGVLRLAPGTYTTGGTFQASAMVSFPWQGLQVEGAGADATILRIDFKRGTSTNPNEAGTMCGTTLSSPNIPLYSMSGSYSSVSDLSVRGGTNGGVSWGPRNTEFGSVIGDCDMDGTAGEGGANSSDGSGLRGIDMSGASWANPIVKSKIARVKVLRMDVGGIQIISCNKCSVTDTEIGYVGENGVGATADDLTYQRMYVHDVQNKAVGGRCIEVFAGSHGATENQSGTRVLDSILDTCVHGVAVWCSSDGSGESKVTISGNTIRNMTWPAGKTGGPNAYGIWIGGTASATGAIKQISVLDNQIYAAGSECVYVDGTTSPLTDILVAGNQVENCNLQKGPLGTTGQDQGMIRVAHNSIGTGIRIERNLLRPGASDNTGIGISGQGTVADGNTITGTFNVDNNENGEIDGRYSGIHVLSSCAGCEVTRNTLRLDQPVDIAASDLFYAINLDSADDTLVAENTVRWTNATTANHEGKWGLRYIAADRTIARNNVFIGGGRAVNADSCSTVTCRDNVFVGNYSANLFATNGQFSFFATARTIAMDNICLSLSGVPCLFLEPDVKSEGNMSYGSVAVTANTGTSGQSHRGGAYYGDSTNAAFDTGDEVCGAEGKTCYDVKTSAGADSACATDQGADGTPNSFTAMCY